ACGNRPGGVPALHLPDPELIRRQPRQVFLLVGVIHKAILLPLFLAHSSLRRYRFTGLLPYKATSATKSPHAGRHYFKRGSPYFKRGSPFPRPRVRLSRSSMTAMRGAVRLHPAVAGSNMDRQGSSRRGSQAARHQTRRPRRTLPFSATAEADLLQPYDSPFLLAIVFRNTKFSANPSPIRGNDRGLLCLCTAPI